MKNGNWGVNPYPFYSSTGELFCGILYKVPRISWQDHAQALAVSYSITHPCIGFSSFIYSSGPHFVGSLPKEITWMPVVILSFAFEEDSQSKQKQFSVFAGRPIQ